MARFQLEKEIKQRAEFVRRIRAAVDAPFDRVFADRASGSGPLVYEFEQSVVRLAVSGMKADQLHCVLDVVSAIAMLAGRDRLLREMQDAKHAGPVRSLQDAVQRVEAMTGMKVEAK